MSEDKISQILKSLNDLKELSNLEHSPCFHPTMCFLNIITFHFLIVFGDLIRQHSKEISKFDYMSLMISILPNQRDLFDS